MRRLNVVRENGTNECSNESARTEHRTRQRNDLALTVVTDRARKRGERHRAERDGKRLMDRNAKAHDEQRDDNAAAARPDKADEPSHKQHRQKQHRNLQTRRTVPASINTKGAA